MIGSSALLILASLQVSDADETGRAPPIGVLAEPPHNRSSILLDRIERQVRLPGNALPLKAYRRYYSLSKGTAGHPSQIIAIYVSDGSPAGRQWVASADLPVVFGGGCHWVSVAYEVTRDRIVSVECNAAR
jgi:hypothetical protein